MINGEKRSGKKDIPPNASLRGTKQSLYYTEGIGQLNFE